MELDFGRHVIASFSFYGYELLFTETMLNSAVVSAVIIGLAACAGAVLKHTEDTPKGWQNALEWGVEAFSGMVEGSVGNERGWLASWYFAVFTYILASNYSGLLGLRPPTANLSVTLSLAISTFALIHITGIRKQKLDYIKGYFEPFPLFFPLNVLSTLALPISLSFRLFGNILGGTVIMTMLHSVLPSYLRLLVPIPFHLYFDIFAGAIQAVIFTMLSLLFIGDKGGK